MNKVRIATLDEMDPSRPRHALVANVDLVIVRENTEDLYSGVEFNPVPDQLRDVLSELSPAFKAFAASAT